MQFIRSHTYTIIVIILQSFRFVAHTASKYIALFI